MHYLIEVAWLWFWLSHWKNHIFLGYESSYDDVFIFPVARLSSHCYWFNVVESLKVSTQNLPKYKMSWSRSSKVVHAANSLSKVHNQSQTDIVPVAGVFCSLLVENRYCPLASFGETTDSATGDVHAALHVPCAVDSLSAETCKVEADAWFLQIFQVLPCWNVTVWAAAVEYVGVALPNYARRTPASIISSPDNPRRQDCYIVIARTTRRQEASLWRGSFAPLLPAVGS